METLSTGTDSPCSRGVSYARYVWWTVALGLAVGCVAFGARLVIGQKQSAKCEANLKAIWLALEHYHERCGSFPPAYVQNEQGQRLHSWRVLLLPDLGYADLYAQYQFDEPWNSPHNATLLPQMPAVYGCPADGKRAEGQTNYFAIVGPQATWPEFCALKKRGDLWDDESETVLLIESVDEGIAWTEPRDLEYAELREGGYHANPRPWFWHTKKIRLLFVDGSIQTRGRGIKDPDMLALCTPRGGELYDGVDWPMPPIPGEIQTVPRPASDLPNTTVMPHLNVPLVAGRNAVYCGNFQLAWDRLRDDVIGAEVELEGDPEMARELNRQKFPPNSLAEDACVAMAGELSSGILDEIRSQMKAKFPTAAPQLLIPAQQAGSIGIVAYAYVQKRLPFEKDFDRLKEPLRFRGKFGEAAVACFGIEDYQSHEPHESALRTQVHVLDYDGPDDFVLRLRTLQDYIVLAKIPRPATLGEALAVVEARNCYNPPVDADEQLMIPLLSLFVKRDYVELTGRALLNPDFSTQPLMDATQLIRFQLDESGAMLDADAMLGALNGDEPPPGPRRFVFDRPFLIYLEQRLDKPPYNAEQPYFVMWVENAEVLVPQ